MELDLVFFDVNETLADLAPVRAAFAACGAPEWAASAWLATTLRDGLALGAAGASAPFAELAECAAREVFLNAEVDGDPAAVLDAVKEMPARPGVREALSAVRDAGVKAATLSNGSAETAAGVLDRAGAGDLVAANLAAHDLGGWKPSPNTYLTACGDLGADPARTALVAVHPWDVDGALRAGLVGAWVDGSGRPYPQAMLAPAVCGPDLVGVVELLLS